MPLLMCPNCNASMQEVNRNGVQLDMCPQCRGVWLDRGELEKLMNSVRAAETELEREYEAAYRQPSPPPVNYDNPWGHKHHHHKRPKSKLERVFDIFD